MSDFTALTGTALITGGSGGLGSAIAELLAQRGATVTLTYRSGKERAEQVAAKIISAGGTAHIVALDLTDAAACATTVDGLVEQHGGLHTLVHAAGPLVPQVHLSRVSPADFQKAMEGEVSAFFNMVHPALPHLRAKDGISPGGESLPGGNLPGGNIVAVTSAATNRWAVRDGLSAGPKSAIESLVRGLAAEEGRFGVRANAVGPGMLEDGMVQTLLAEGHYRESDLDAARNNIALRRFGSASDVAHAVAFLASPQAGYISGQILNVDGGYTV